MSVPTPSDAPIGYAYKASLIGSAQEFELTEQGLSWRFAGHAGVWPYADIAAIRLSYRPVSMQAKRFRAEITHRDGRRLNLISTTWQTVTLMVPQSEAYRTFILALHARLAAAGSTARLTGGLGRTVYTASMMVMAVLTAAMAALLVRALAIAEWSGALFLIGFAALFAWQVGGFVIRNKPQTYSFADIPRALLP
ncbi:hypothetical protein HL667_32470 [Bradyrhizobium sp. 83012]|uniref:Bll5862 protein n=1 Tax=Bradyrhizobium aeschynomenes TaxID=2734909 RepID=A0ABX2CQP6_9BRAD|nr:hypothetical protein [Bradyrhizobium aeschynomenes]NPU12533.1 hypothetical protein [Bradyrhizobium aeschynomenes]NPU69744.1 hypothetical protein [Bradyrhizobium aeschynomenes]NPV23089.1 hypothetical protein [Bradyrhizobium aeschynomenes]